MKNLLKIFTVAFVFFASSCSLFELEENLDNPNEVSAESLDVTTLFNKIQAEFADFYNEANVKGMELTRMTALINGDTYERAYQGQNVNELWERAYQDVLVQIKSLQGKTDGTAFSIHSGASRVLEAYVWLTLVDMFGNIPYSEALKGTNGASAYNPKADDGTAIYTAALATLDQALVDLAKTGAVVVTRDVYYGGSAAKWAALARTLQLKAYMNLSLKDASVKSKIEALLAADIIDTDGEEFTYKYAASDNPARSRHPWYRRQYQPVAGAADDYIGNFFLRNAYIDPTKGVEDPRWRYYFYRQYGSLKKMILDEPESIPCRFSPKPGHYSPDQPWCAFEPGFFGREHGNNDGIPPDAQAKTVWGVYPAGGRADVTDVTNENYVGPSQQGQGANGAGIEPIWLASFTDFVKAEAVLSLGVAGDAKALVESGVKKSIARVQKFGADKGQPVPAALVASDAAYLAKVSDLMSTSSDKLGVAMREYYIALWGNGIEAYNLYRRTGKPNDIQPMRTANAGIYLHSLVYPSDYVNLNSNATQKDETKHNPVFWDNHPANFVY